MKKDNGFTLIELILYIAILVTVLSALLPFAWNAVESGAKSMVMQEVTSNARLISERIKLEIRNASGINSLTPTSLSLATLIPATNPTIIDLVPGNIRIKQGAGVATNLNSTHTRVSSLNFVNLTSVDTKSKHVQFSLTLESNFVASRQEYQSTMTVEGSGEVRSN